MKKLVTGAVALLFYLFIYFAVLQDIGTAPAINVTIAFMIGLSVAIVMNNMWGGDR